MKVLPIKNQDAAPWLLEKHYARRMCPISFAFGLFERDTLLGVVTYGVPATAVLRKGLCGEDWANNVLELNRLCIESTNKNAASILVGRSLQMLPKPSVIVSYADEGQNHVGYIYQATNFDYTGLSSSHMDWKVKGLEHLHTATLVDEFRGCEDRLQRMKDKYGDKMYKSYRDRKHRYVFFCGDKRDKRKMRSDLRYGIEDYPKGESKRYDAGGEVATQGLLFS